MVKILLVREKSTNPKKPVEEGQTPVMIVNMFGHRSVIAQLQCHEVVTHSTT